jgi:hypothetical protein
MYNNNLKSRKWLTISCAINERGGYWPIFHISGERIKDDYIQTCTLGTCMAMQKKVWMTCFMFKTFCLAHLLLLPNLPIRKTRGTKPLVNYNKSHVVTSNKYLKILW